MIRANLTYSHLFRLADHAFGERARGVMAIICDKNRETVIGYVGALRRPCPAAARSDSHHRQPYRLLACYEADYVFAYPDLVLQDMRPWRDRLVCHRPANQGRELDDLHPDRSADTDIGVHRDPKAVRLSHENLASVTGCIADYLGLDQWRRPFRCFRRNIPTGCPFEHDHGGTRVQITDLSPVTRDFWQIIATGRDRFFRSSPSSSKR